MTSDRTSTVICWLRSPRATALQTRATSWTCDLRRRSSSTAFIPLSRAAVSSGPFFATTDGEPGDSVVENRAILEIMPVSVTRPLHVGQSMYSAKAATGAEVGPVSGPPNELLWQNSGTLGSSMDMEVRDDLELLLVGVEDASVLGVGGAVYGGKLRANGFWAGRAAGMRRCDDPVRRSNILPSETRMESVCQLHGPLYFGSCPPGVVPSKARKREVRYDLNGSSAMTDGAIVDEKWFVDKTEVGGQVPPDHDVMCSPPSHSPRRRPRLRSPPPTLHPYCLFTFTRVCIPDAPTIVQFSAKFHSKSKNARALSTLTGASLPLRKIPSSHALLQCEASLLSLSVHVGPCSCLYACEQLPSHCRLSDWVSHKPISDPRYRSAEPQTEIARLLLTTVVNVLLPFQYTLIQAESTLLCYSVFLQASMLSVHCAYGLVTMRVPAPGVARHVHAPTVGATRSTHCSSLAQIEIGNKHASLSPS